MKDIARHRGLIAIWHKRSGTAGTRHCIYALCPSCCRPADNWRHLTWPDLTWKFSVAESNRHANASIANQIEIKNSNSASEVLRNRALQLTFTYLHVYTIHNHNRVNLVHHKYEEKKLGNMCKQNNNTNRRYCQYWTMLA